MDWMGIEDDAGDMTIGIGDEVRDMTEDRG